MEHSLTIASIGFKYVWSDEILFGPTKSRILSKP